MNDISLTPAQHAILAYAIEHTAGKIEWFPGHIKGGARNKVLGALAQRALITPAGSHWFVSAEGYEALGIPRRGPITLDLLESVIATAEAASPEAPQPRTRENSKQAQVIALLKRPEGATVPQIMALTGWKAHTVRGAFAGAFKKKLGLVITSEKPEGGERIYKLCGVSHNRQEELAA